MIISGIAFDRPDRHSRLRAFPCDRCKIYPIVPIVRIELSSGSFAIVRVAFQYDRFDRLNIIWDDGDDPDDNMETRLYAALSSSDPKWRQRIVQKFASSSSDLKVPICSSCHLKYNITKKNTGTRMIINNKEGVFLTHSLPEILWRNVFWSWSNLSGPIEPKLPKTPFIGQALRKPLKSGWASTESTIQDLIFAFSSTVFFSFLAPFSCWAFTRLHFGGKRFWENF